MKSLLDKRLPNGEFPFKYEPSHSTNIRRTFERIRKAAPQVPEVPEPAKRESERFGATQPAVSAPNQKTAAQELPAVNSASRQDTSASSTPGTVGRSDIRPTKVDAAPVRDSAKQPAFAAPVTQIRRKTCSSR